MPNIIQTRNSKGECPRCSAQEGKKLHSTIHADEYEGEVQHTTFICSECNMPYSEIYTLVYQYTIHNEGEEKNG